LVDRGQSGFTVLEMAVAMVLLLVGLLATASAISYALMASNRGRGITNTKLLVVSMLDQMETLRNTKQLTFGQIANVNDVDNTGATTTFAGFPTGAQPLSTDAGLDGIYGTADDVTTTATLGYTRQIAITTLSSNIKKITVTVTYPGPAGDKQTLTASSYLNNDAQANYLP
jgi:prepilin-type N-terminal cleavage/methylation domain-containing protein